jgi:hypothetical protein
MRAESHSPCKAKEAISHHVALAFAQCTPRRPGKMLRYSGHRERRPSTLRSSRPSIQCPIMTDQHQPGSLSRISLSLRSASTRARTHNRRRGDRALHHHRLPRSRSGRHDRCTMQAVSRLARQSLDHQPCISPHHLHWMYSQASRCRPHCLSLAP